MKLDELTFKVIFEWSKGNPGALFFFRELFKPENLHLAMGIVLKLDQMPSIRGTNAYVLWSDLCHKDLKNVAILCKNCPKEILEDACSRQDYSGRKLVEKYF